MDLPDHKPSIRKPWLRKAEVAKVIKAVKPKVGHPLRRREISMARINWFGLEADLLPGAVVVPLPRRVVEMITNLRRHCSNPVRVDVNRKLLIFKTLRCEKNSRLIDHGNRSR